MKKTLIALACTLTCTAAFAQTSTEDQIKKNLESAFPQVKVEKVFKGNRAGLWEVYGGGTLVYTDEKASFILQGQMIDVATKKNLTEEKLNTLTRIDWKELPLAQSFKMVNGDGSREMAVFVDPNCGYCKRYEATLKDVPNVTIHVFMAPILGADSAEKSKSVWCSKDKALAWRDLMIDGKAPTAKGDCQNPVDANFAMAQKIGVRGTPTTFFKNGTSADKVVGAVSPQEIEAKLKK